MMKTDMAEITLQAMYSHMKDEFETVRVETKLVREGLDRLDAKVDVLDVKVDVLDAKIDRLLRLPGVPGSAP
jgi:predicted nuclease with TOPRIM domain